MSNLSTLPLAVLQAQRAQALGPYGAGPQSGFATPGGTPMGLPGQAVGGSRVPGQSSAPDTKLPPTPPPPNIDATGALDMGSASAADHIGRGAGGGAGLDFANLGGIGGGMGILNTPTDYDKNMALAQAGFAAMGSGSPWGGVAIGQGMTAGLKALQERQAQRAEAAIRLAELQRQSAALSQQAAYQTGMLGLTQQQRDLEAAQQPAKLKLLAAQTAAEQARAAQEAAQARMLSNPLGIFGMGGGSTSGGGGGSLAAPPPAASPASVPVAPPAGGAAATPTKAAYVPVSVPDATPALESLPGMKGALIPVADKTDAYKDTGDAPVQTGTLNLSPQGKAIWDQLPPAAQSLVGAMLEGRMQAPSGYALGKSPMLMSLVTLANQIDPTFDQGNWQARVNLRKSVMGGGQQANNIAALRLFYQHIGQLDDDQKALHNGDWALANGAENAVAGQWQGYGADDSGRTRSDILAAIKKDTDLVSNEAMKVARGTGQPSEKEAEQFRVGFSPTDAYHTSHAGNVRLGGLVQARMNAVEQQWKDTFGQTLPFNMLTPEAQRVHDSLAAPAAPANVPRIPTDPDSAKKVWDAMPSGAHYINWDGRPGVKP